MRKQQVQYKSSLDALIAVAKRLSLYESQHNMDSEDFLIAIARDNSLMRRFLLIGRMIIATIWGCVRYLMDEITFLKLEISLAELNRFFSQLENLR